MGKKRIVKKRGGSEDAALKARQLARTPKKRFERGVLSVLATFNNTLVTFSDDQGNAIMQSSSGALGFKGAKKGTPFAAAKVGEVLGEKATALGVREVRVVVKGVGSGRESAVRAFAGKGIGVSSIQDRTPVPHNGPRAPKPRRV